MIFDMSSGDHNKRTFHIDNEIFWALIAFSAFVLLMIALIFGRSLGITPKDNTNPAIFTRFQEIEKDCLYEQARGPLSMSVRCEKVLSLMDYCTNKPDPCGASFYYEQLSALEFELPPLKLQN